MKKSILRASAALQAVALLGAGSAAFIAATPAAAQDYTSGVLSGTVSNDAGRPIAGAQVVAKSIQLGTTISATTGANGEFTFASLPTGDYDVTVTSSGSQSYTATAVQVISGRTSSLPVVLSTQQSIVVVGRRVQAFTGTTTGLNVDVQQLQATVPIGRNLTSVVLLAPTTSQGDSAFGNLASVGGGSVAENAYYINGLNITNFDNYVGSATVPFDFYKSVEVKEGGYPAEFGRATGGIINAVTKSGTNDWMGAVHVTWSPEFLRDDSHVIQTCNYTDDTNTTTECSDANAPKYEYDKRLETSLELGGPIFRDRLFVYGLLQLNDHRYRTTSLTSSTAYEYRNNDPFWGAKVDAIPIDGHHFEFTIFDTRNTTYRLDRPFSVDGSGDGVFGIGTAENAFHGGGVNYVAKYTGRLTDFFTISGAYGRYRDRFDYNAVAGAAGLPLVQNLTGGDVTSNGEVVPYLGYTTAQRIGSYQAPYKTERKFWRGDADLLVNFIGSHHFRAGIDHENDFLQEGTYRSGNDFLCNTINPATGLPYITAEACTTNGQPAGLEYLLRAGGKVELNYYNTKGQFTQKNSAIYLEDEWKPTDRLTINAGIRRDNFEVTDAAGQPFATLKNNWSPRVGITYNLWADKSGTIKAFYGTYYLPFASNTAFRNVGGELYFHQRYFYNGFDANGIPIIDLTKPVTNRGDYQARCPFDLVPGAVDDFCSVTGDGKVPSSATVIDHNLKATKEAEWILGYEQRWHGWKFGITGTYRKLLIESEDSAIDAAALAYCEANGISDVVNPDTGYTCAEYYTGFAQYVINNPGNPITVNLRGVEGQPLVTLTPEQLGYPKAKRTYKALEFTFDRPYDGVWSLGGSYTLSYSKGNSEGFVQSDFGQDDSGITQDFDQPGFIPGAYGYLPNDRRHKLKIYGSYTLWDRLTLGANYILQSPRHLSCFGYNPTDNFANVYGAASHYCGGVLSPRGTAQKSAWLSQLDLKVAYKVPLNVLGSNLTLRADVFNVFNSRSVQKRNEIGDLDYTPGDDGLPIAYLASPNYGLGTNYQAPRQIRLGLDIAFGGAAPPPPPPVEVAPPPPPPPAPPATQTCSDGSVILATDACPVPPPPPPPPAPAPERGN